MTKRVNYKPLFVISKFFLPYIQSQLTIFIYFQPNLLSFSERSNDKKIWCYYILLIASLELLKYRLTDMRLNT